MPPQVFATSRAWQHAGMRFSRRAVLALVAAAVAPLALVPAAASVAAQAPAHGAIGGGDPYFPRLGNGGYQVRSYAIHIAYTPSTHHLSGDVTVHAVSTEALSRFDLDLRRTMKVSTVLVDGQRARFSQPQSLVQELVITPPHALGRGKAFTVRVRYAGTPHSVVDPDGSLDGFVTTTDGAFVASEPQGSPSWFPVNDTPRDKATYSVSVSVPKGLVAMSNGRLVSHRTGGSRTTWSWQLDQPVSSYLITATIGRFAVTRGRSASGIPYITAISPQEKSASTVMKEVPKIVDYFQKVYGRYPFGVTGGIVAHAHQVGYALETASRPLFDRAPDIQTLSHELAHQWFGDEVTLARWRDIWLNEGFAEFSSWLWDEHRGAMTAKQHLQALLARPASDTTEWDPPPGNPGSAADVFSDSVYDRGAGTLEALRETVGSTTFFQIMRGWLRLHRFGNAQVPQFTAYAAHVAHRDLTAFFHRWLYAAGKP